jgi:hypothetical protein
MIGITVFRAFVEASKTKKDPNWKKEREMRGASKLTNCPTAQVVEFFPSQISRRLFVPAGQETLKQ